LDYSSEYYRQRHIDWIFRQHRVVGFKAAFLLLSRHGREFIAHSVLFVLFKPFLKLSFSPLSHFRMSDGGFAPVQLHFCLGFYFAFWPAGQQRLLKFLTDGEGMTSRSHRTRRARPRNKTSNSCKTLGHTGTRKSSTVKMELEKWEETAKKCKYLPENDLKRLCDLVCDLLLEESNIQPVSTPVTVCGDIHGQVRKKIQFRNVIRITHWFAVP
jgi:hypothetical protein